MSNSCKKISVSTILFNRWPLSKRTLKSIAQTIPTEYEIEWIVADNASTDETKVEAEDFLKSLRGIVKFFIRLEEGIKVVDLSNRLTNMADTEYILRVDNDLEFVDGWFQDCISIFRSKDSSDLCFISPSHHIKHLDWYTPRLKKIGGVYIDMVSEGGRNVPGNYFMRTAVLRDIGGFYSPYSLVHCDVHHSLIARQIGYRYAYLWDKSAKHIGEHDTNTEYSQMAIKSRFDDNARFEDITRGNAKGKHPQEVEFVAKIHEFKNSHFKRLVYYTDMNILVLGGTKRLHKEFVKIFDIPRFSGHVHLADIVNPQDLVTFCRSNGIRYVFPSSRQHYDICKVASDDLLANGYTEVPQCNFVEYPPSGDIDCPVFRANIVSNRMSEVVSMVNVDISTEEFVVINQVHLFNQMLQISQYHRCIGPWSIDYSIVNEKLVVSCIRPYIDERFLISSMVGQPQMLIALKCFERDFHTFYHWKYMVDFGTKIVEEKNER